MLPGRSKSNFVADPRQTQGPTSSAKEYKDDMHPDLDIRMRTAKGLPSLADGTIGVTDVHMSTLTPTGKAQPVFKTWEREALNSNEVKRKATVAQLCMSF
jgi:hypothetical protein